MDTTTRRGWVIIAIMGIVIAFATAWGIRELVRKTENAARMQSFLEQRYAAELTQLRLAMLSFDPAQTENYDYVKEFEAKYRPHFQSPSILSADISENSNAGFVVFKPASVEERWQGASFSRFQQDGSPLMVIGDTSSNAEIIVLEGFLKHAPVKKRYRISFLSEGVLREMHCTDILR